MGRFYHQFSMQSHRRSIILLVIVGLFLSWYGINWAYQTYYDKPRKELGAKIAQYEHDILAGKNNIANMQQFIGRNQSQMLYYRSMPRTPNDVRSQYTQWLFELMKYCDVKEPNIVSDVPSVMSFDRRNYRFHVRGTCSLDQLNRLLFEFASAPFLHRISNMLIAAQEKTGLIGVALTIDALAIPPRNRQDPYPPLSQMPTGYWQRLGSNDFEVYRVVSQRNLLQAARGGIDKADYTYLTTISQVGDEKEVWFTVRTEDNRVEHRRQGDAIHFGSFRAKILEVTDEDVLVDRDGTLWLLTVGDCLNQAFALPPELRP